MPDNEDGMPNDDHDHDEERNSRSDRRAPIVLRESTQFTIDIKFVIILVMGALGLGGTWVEQKYALKTQRFEIDAQLVDVRNAALRDKGETNNRLTNLEKATCAIAKKVGAGDSGCP